MSTGYLALVFTRAPAVCPASGYEEFLEEDWLYAAITETYIPLLGCSSGWRRKGVDFKVTMSLTPPLCAMLQDEKLKDPRSAE